MVLNSFFLNGGKRKICRNYVDKLWKWGGGGQVIEIEEVGIHHCVRYVIIRVGQRISKEDVACGVVVMRPLSCLLFTPVLWLVSHHLFFSVCWLFL